MGSCALPAKVGIAINQHARDPIMSDLPASSSTSALLTVGGSLSDVIETNGDKDWVRIDLAPGEWVQVVQRGTGQSPLEDAFMSVYDDDGNLVTSDDELNSENSDFDAAVVFGGGAGGTYYIEAGAYRDMFRGGYTLDAVSVAPPTTDLLGTLDSGTQRNDSDNVVTVYFVPSGQRRDGLTSEGWTAYEQQRFEAGLAAIAAVANITFVTTTNPNADFQLVLDSDEFVNEDGSANRGLLGYFYLPFGTTSVGAFNAEGFGWNTNGGLEEGGLGFATIVHEALHGLGLAHPHDGSSVVPAVDIEFDDLGVNGLNQGVFTTMSYNSGYAGVANFSNNYGGEAGPMALDIAALQQLYGANTSTATGDDTYLLPNTNSAGTAWRSIWDAGGEDTIEYAGSRDVTIDLRAATLTNELGGGGFLSSAAGRSGGFTIANGVVIENASGGSGNDLLIGNAAGNTLSGNDGNDRLIGGAGDDELFGGNDSDLILGDAGDDVIHAGSGNDVTHGGAGDDTIDSGGGNDTVFGNSGSDHILGDSGTNELYGNSGKDVIDGGSDSDIINGGSGDDILRGHLSDDILLGERGRDTLEGGSGNDVLNGGLDADTLTGGEGADVFVFSYASDSFASQRDTITDFEIALDQIDLSSVATSQALTFIGSDSFDSAAQVRLAQSGSDTIVQLDKDGDGIAEMEIHVVGVSGLTSGDFII